jgi:hypothetical protein
MFVHLASISIIPTLQAPTSTDTNIRVGFIFTTTLAFFMLISSTES